MIEERVKEIIRNVPDFPKPGILFKDITPLFLHPELCTEILQFFCNRCSGRKIDAIASVESRGFIFGFALAQKLNVPFIPVRKAGKLPFKTLSFEYNLEYGSAKMEIHKDALKPGDNVLVHDDLLATGGTAAAASELIQMLGGTIAGYAFLVELGFLNGSKILKKYSSDLFTLAKY